MKVDGVFLARALHLKKTSSPLTVEGTLHLRLSDWARHRHTARQLAAAESQERLAPHQYFMFAANIILQRLGVCRMIMDNMAFESEPAVGEQGSECLCIRPDTWSMFTLSY